MRQFFLTRKDMNKFITVLSRYKLVLVVFFTVVFIATPYVADAYREQGTMPIKQAKVVLGEKTTKTVSPTPTVTPVPTVTSTIVPQKIPSPTVTQAPTPTPTGSTQSNSSTSTVSPTTQPTTAPIQVSPTNTPVQTATPSPTATPTPARIPITISIDYGGQKTNDSYSVTVERGQNAWETIKTAIGVENLQYTDYGADLGIFITGFNGIFASSNQFYEFRVNGASSNVGISSYVCQTGDSLSFILTTF